MGKILRIGNDTVTNYSLQATSAYDENAPAATTSPWPDSAAMDQAFDQPNPVEITEEGVLVTFDRTPFAFEGAIVKIRPLYNTSIGEDPFFELWTHDSITTNWTKRRRIELSNLFVGVASDQRKVVDFTFFPFLSNVDMVWITMDPGTVGAPTMRWDAIHLFGQCERNLRVPHPTPGDDDPCDPNSPFYTGFKEDGTPCKPTGDCPLPPEFCVTPPAVDVCNPASIATYEEYLRGIGGGTLEAFQAWYDLNAASIASTCAGNEPVPETPPMPEPPLPPLPPLDLCDQDSIDAFRAAVAGDAEQLATFDAFIDQLTDDGYFDLVCPPPDPPEVPIDPKTLEPEPDPDPPDTPIRPFGDGPGGQPPPTNPPRAPGGPGFPGQVIERTNRYVLVWSGNDIATAVSMVTSLGIPPLPVSTLIAKRETFNANYGPNIGVPTVGLGYTPAAYAFLLQIRNLPTFATVGLRMQEFKMRGTAGLAYSISDTGIRSVPSPCPPPVPPLWYDWTIVPSEGFTLAGAPIIGDNYYEYIFHGAGLVNQATISVAVPRTNPAQNVFSPCTPTTAPYSQLAFQRGGCFVGLAGKAHWIWIQDVSNADYDASGIFDYIHQQPIAMVFDVTVRAQVVSGVPVKGPAIDVRDTSIVLATASDAQATETCP